MARPSKPWFWKQRQIWCVTIDGKRVQLSEDKDEAFRKFHTIKAEKLRLHEECLAVVVDELLDWTKKHRREGTYRFYVEHAKQFSEWLEENGISAIECDELTVAIFESYLDDISPGRRCGAVQVIKRVYNWGIKRGRIQANPIMALEKPRSGRRQNYIESATFSEMLKECDQHLRDLLRFCWETGCRPQEAWRLKPVHIQSRYQRCVIPIGETKRNKYDRKIYCNDPAWKIVTRLKTNRGFLFTNSVGTQWNKNNISNRMESLRKHVGKRYALYDIRHTWITNRVKDGMDVHLIAKLAGTSVLMIEKYYDHSDQDAEFMLELVNGRAF